MIKAKATLYSKANAPCKHLFQIFQLVPLEKKTKFLTIESLQPTIIINSVSIKLEQLEFKLEKNIGIQNQ